MRNQVYDYRRERIVDAEPLEVKHFMQDRRGMDQDQGDDIVFLFRAKSGEEGYVR